MIKNFIEKHGLEYYEDASLKKYHTYRVDAKGKYLVFPKDLETLRELIRFLRENHLKYLVLGNGSNVIFKNDYYDGVVIFLSQFHQVVIDGEKVEVEAGYFLPKLALETTKMGLGGLEFASGIPGFVGASIAMNAGAYKSSISELVESVMVLNPDLEFVRMRKEDLAFTYRSSFFKEHKDYIIVSACLKLTRSNPEELLEKISKRRVKRLETQPLDMPSAGSVFRNPDNDSAGALIEKCGLKGFQIGGAMVSEKHANFIVNVGNATGRDIVEVIDHVRTQVKGKFDIELILEQIIVD